MTRRTAGLATVAVSLALGTVLLFAEKEDALFFLAGLLLVAGLLVTYLPANLLSPAELVRSTGSRRTRALVLAGLALGLVIRAALIGRYGTEDPGIDLALGHRVVSHGLASAFENGFYPAQSQEFGSVVAVSRELGLSQIVVFKAVSLVADLLCTELSRFS